MLLFVFLFYVVINGRGEGGGSLGVEEVENLVLRHSDNVRFVMPEREHLNNLFP